MGHLYGDVYHFGGDHFVVYTDVKNNVVHLKFFNITCQFYPIKKKMTTQNVADIEQEEC